MRSFVALPWMDFQGAMRLKLALKGSMWTGRAAWNFQRWNLDLIRRLIKLPLDQASLV